MSLMIKLAAAVCLAATSGLAGNWSGALVDSKCFDGEERNVGPTDALTNVDRDRGEEIRFCSPNSKTKAFTVVERDGLSFKLDAGGNSKAVELVRNAGKKPHYVVTVTGEMSKNTVKVDSISVVR